MLKLTMNPRKRSRKSRLHHGKRHLSEFKLMETRCMLEDNVKALLVQEKSGRYQCADYLSMTSWQRSVYDFIKRERYSSDHQGDARIDEYCRDQIVEWTFRVVDYFHIDREVVAVSLSFLDRFLVTCQCDRSTFKLAATSSLNSSTQVHRR